jgi:DNA gyrase subunit A
MGRTSRGVIGIRLSPGDELAGVVAIAEDEALLMITEFGYGKRTIHTEFNPHGRGTRGQIAYGCNPRTGEVVGVLTAKDDAEVIIITSQGQTIKITGGGIPIQGRSAMGVRVVNIEKPDFVVGIDRSADEDQDENDSDDGAEET